MYISIPLLITIIIIIGLAWYRQRKAYEAAINELYAALKVSSEATNLFPRLRKLTDIYEQVDDKGSKVELRRAFNVLEEFVHRGYEFAERHRLGKSPLYYESEFGDGFDSLDSLAFLADADGETIEKRYEHIIDTGYDYEKLKAGYKAKSKRRTYILD